MPNPIEKKGIYQLNETTGEWEYGGATKIPGKVPMPLQEYLNRKHHVTKGSWKRPTDPKHVDPRALKEFDMGSCGCRRGMHCMIAANYTKCKYCNLTQKEINKNNERKDTI